MFTIQSLSAERAAFFHEIGRALSQWAHVEQQLQRLCECCVLPLDTKAIATGFRSIENFRSRLQFCDRLLQQKLTSKAHLEKWESLKDRTERFSTRRNKLAHHPSAIFPNAKTGRRVALVPWIPQESHNSRKRSAESRAINAPENSLCLRDIAALCAGLHALTTALANFRELICVGVAPFPESYEREGATEETGSIMRRIRAAFALRAKSSPRKS